MPGQPDPVEEIGDKLSKKRELEAESSVGE